MRALNRMMNAILLLSVVAALVTSGSIVGSQASAASTSPLESSSVLRVDGDTDLASTASSGSGTLSDPYIIENLDINATGYGAGIYIGNTTKYLIIRDCVVSGAANSGAPYSPGAGVALYNVQHCTVTENALSGCLYGIYLHSSEGNMVTKNVCIGNSAHGMDLHASDHNTLSGNICRGNANYGLYMFSSSGNTISKNTFDGNGQYGIYLWSFSDDNHIHANALSGNNGATADFSSSHVQAFDGCDNEWNTTSYGNYWSDWTSPDNNDDGIIDLPYAIHGGSSRDLLPVNLAVNIAYPSSTLRTNLATITLSGTATDGSGHISLTWSNEAAGASGVCAGTASWTATVPLVVGVNEIAVTISDEGGMTISDRVTVISDPIAPTMTGSPTGEGIDIDAVVVVAFSEQMDEDTVQISIPGVNGSVAWDGWIATFTPTSLSHNSDYTVSVNGSDLAGNEIETSWTFSTIRVGSVKGMIVDKNGNLLFNATVSLDNDMITTTDSFGRFTFNNVMAGDYSLTAVREGYDNLSLEITVSQEGVTQLGELTMVVANASLAAAPGSDNTMLFIIIGVAAAAGVGVFFFIKKRKG